MTHPPSPRSAAPSVFPNATIPAPRPPTDSTATATVTASTDDGCSSDFDAATATHYETLGVTAGASPDEIKRAFRALALRCHPDQRARRRRRRQRQWREERGRGDGAERGADAITSAATSPPSRSGSGSGTAHCNVGTDGGEADRDGTSDDAGGNEQIASEESPSPSLTSEDEALSAVNSADDDDEKDEEDGGGAVREEEEALAFRRIREAYGVLRCHESRELYDATLRREAARRDQRRAAASATGHAAAAARVALSEMDCEVCEVVCSSSSDGEEDGDGDWETDRGGRTTDGGDEMELERVYTYPCRCGDGVEVMESELPQLPLSDDVPVDPSPIPWDDGWKRPGGCRDGAASSTSAVFQCRSCSLSVWIDLSS